jgi:hypothetical protein
MLIVYCCQSIGSIKQKRLYKKKRVDSIFLLCARVLLDKFNLRNGKLCLKKDEFCECIRIIWMYDKREIKRLVKKGVIFYSKKRVISSIVFAYFRREKKSLLKKCILILLY